MKDFTLQTYKALINAIIESNVPVFTFEEYCSRHPQGKYIIFRHDVDDKPERSLVMAQLENKLGIRSTYYFRIVPQSNQLEIIKQIAELGHEIGYHYEDLNMANGNINRAFESYEKNLAYFRQFYSIKTISMHGSPREKFDNRHLWKHYDYHQFDVVGEPYFDFLNRNDVVYLTDTGRMWDGDKYNIRDKAINQISDSIQNQIPKIHSTFDLISWILSDMWQSPLMISTHPQRWTDNSMAWCRERIFQALKNQVKALIK